MLITVDALVWITMYVNSFILFHLCRLRMNMALRIRHLDQLVMHTLIGLQKWLLGTGVPWVMCKEDDASDPVVNCFTLSPSLIFPFLSNDLLFNSTIFPLYWIPCGLERPWLCFLSHLENRKMHVKLCENALVSLDPTITSFVLQSDNDIVFNLGSWYLTLFERRWIGVSYQG